MSKEQTPIIAQVLPVNGIDSAATENPIKEYVRHWPIFILSVTLFIAAAYFYLEYANPIYPITATLKFKTATRSPSSNSLENLDPSSSPIVVTNEIEVLRSNRIIFQVVKDLQLWVNYSIKEWPATNDLYKNTPVLFSFSDSNIALKPGGETLEIIIIDSNSFVLKVPGNEDKTHTFTAPVKSTFGTWQLKPTSTIGNYVGSKIVIEIKDPDLVAGSYQAGIVVALKYKDAPFVTLSMLDDVPARGRDILNSIIALYMVHAKQEKNEQTQKTFEFVNARVDSVKHELEMQERNLEAYKRDKGITNINAQAENFRNTQEQNTRAINSLNTHLSVLDSLEKYAVSSAYEEKLPAMSETFSDPDLVRLYNKLTDLQLLRQQKLAITPATNPLFVSIDTQINTLKKEYREKIKTIKAALIANKQQLESIDKGLQSSLKTIPAWEMQFKALSRDLESKETLFKFLASKREEIALRFASLTPDCQIVDDAHAGAIKWPQTTLVYSAALILGLIGAAGFMYLREILNERITNSKQLEDETRIPVLGEIAYHTSRDPLVVTKGRNKFAIGEQFRTLRTNLYHWLGSSPRGRVTLFTSSVRGEGKSFISSNLAVTMAFASKKTIILEMDLRKPRVAAVFGLTSEHPGISDYLNDESVKLESMIRASGITGLDVLSCGSLLPNPSELLGKERLDELIVTLREKYDDIIIDSPPTHVVSDALIIARIADATLYVVRLNHTHKSEIAFINETYTSKRFKKFSLVLNGVKPSRNYRQEYK